MLRKSITLSTPVVITPRLQQVAGLFDLPIQGNSVSHWDVALELPDKWNIGAIVGPSGCGKSTVAAELFGDWLCPRLDWPADRSLVDAFPAALPIRKIVALLCAVGFSSPVAWVRPFVYLSTGQQFRATLARVLAESTLDRKPRAVDEYSSTVDRTVAQIGSSALAGAVRAGDLQFVAITCHYDVLPWLRPDWVYEPHTGRTLHDRGWLRRRPAIELEIRRTDSSAWKLFAPHHYLSGDLHRSAACYLASVNDQPAAFTAVLAFPHPRVPGWREHRTVCLPDYQGVGIGNAMSEFVASLYSATGKPYTSTTSHPAMIQRRCHSAVWKLIRGPGLVSRHAGGAMGRTSGNHRLTAGFRYVGPARSEEARQMGIAC